MKTNTAQVTSDLGGGSKCHLGLVLTHPEYTQICAFSYVKPVHPGTLVIAAGTTQYDVTWLREEHNDAILIFHETTDVEKAFIKRIVEAVKGEYIDNLRSPVTNTIDMDVPTILAHLFRNYGYVTPEVLAENTATVKKMQYSVEDHLVTV